MAILKIARMGHPILRSPAEAVADPTAPEIRALVGDMWETLADIGGAGLAAPQVHVGKRVVIFHVPEARAEREGALGGSADGADQPGDRAPGRRDGRGLGSLPVGARPDRLGSPLFANPLSRADAGRRAASSARPAAFMPAWCSMNAIIWMACCIRCA